MPKRQPTAAAADHDGERNNNQKRANKAAQDACNRTPATLDAGLRE
jgi:hypothetical protein